MKKLPGHSLLEVLTSLSILSLLFVLGLSLSARLTGLYSPPEQQITRTLVQNMLQAPPDWEVATVEKWEKGRRLEGKLKLLSPENGLYE